MNLFQMIRRHAAVAYLLFSVVVIGIMLYTDEGACRIDLTRLQPEERGLLALECVCFWAGLLTADHFLRIVRCRMLLALLPGMIIGAVYMGVILLFRLGITALF
ncbi:MAG: hypothetical protein QM743_07725 [Chitinophagaceae bacterium]